MCNDTDQVKREKAMINTLRMRKEPSRCCTAVEHPPINKRGTVQFPFRAHARVSGLIPSRGHAESS